MTQHHWELSHRTHPYDVHGKHAGSCSTITAFWNRPGMIPYCIPLNCATRPSPTLTPSSVGPEGWSCSVANIGRVEWWVLIGTEVGGFWAK